MHHFLYIQKKMFLKLFLIFSSICCYFLMNYSLNQCQNNEKKDEKFMYVFLSTSALFIFIYCVNMIQRIEGR